MLSVIPSSKASRVNTGNVSRVCTKLGKSCRHVHTPGEMTWSTPCRWSRCRNGKYSSGVRS